jgi:hypothetical protein
VATDGSYSLRVELQEGSNSIQVTATDTIGNVATASVAVTFNDPFASLAQELEAAWAHQNATAAALLVVEAQLAALQADANTTASDLAAAQAALSTAQADLAAAQAQVTALQAQLSTTNAAVNATNAQINDIENGSLKPVPQGDLDAATANASMMMMLGILGLAVAAAGIVAAAVLGRKRGGRPAASLPPPAAAPPAAAAAPAPAAAPYPAGGEHESFDLEEPAAQAKSIKCPKCGTLFPGPATRPATVECPNCGAKGTLK